MDLSPEQIALNGYWHEQRYKLVALTESLAPQVSDVHRFQVWDWVDHNEIGIGFDHLLWILFDEPEAAVSLSESQAEQLRALGKAMNYSAQSNIVYKIFLEKYFPDELGDAERE